MSVPLLSSKTVGIFTGEKWRRRMHKTYGEAGTWQRHKICRRRGYPDPAHLRPWAQSHIWQKHATPAVHRPLFSRSPRLPPVIHPPPPTAAFHSPRFPYNRVLLFRTRTAPRRPFRAIAMDDRHPPPAAPKPTRSPEPHPFDNAIRAVKFKKPVPEMDFTLHTMDDGSQVNTQDRVCKGRLSLASSHANEAARPPRCSNR
jgi:hypothetical protein